MESLLITFAFVIFGLLSLITYLARKIKALPAKIIVSEPPARSRIELFTLLNRMIIESMSHDGKVNSGLCNMISTMRVIEAISYEETKLMKRVLQERFDPNNNKYYYWPKGDGIARVCALNEFIKELKKERLDEKH